MVTKITGGGKGSCIGLAQYLEKETPGNWFTTNQDNIDLKEVITCIDSNKKNLSHQDDKYYQVILSPSQAEQKHILNNLSQFESFTREAMQAYATQFGKGIESQDLVWFAKIEQSRTYSHTDKAVQQDQRTEGQYKEGSQMHVHIIVSRTENLNRFQEKKDAGLIDRNNPLKLSPLTNHRATNQGAVQGGFNRTAFKQSVEEKFDKLFAYERPLHETFRYANALQKGSQEERISLRLEALRQEPNYLLSQTTNRHTKQHNQQQPLEKSKEDFQL